MEYTDFPETENHGWDKIYQQVPEIQKTPITSTNGEMGSYNIQSKACQGVHELWQEIIEEQAIQQSQKLLDKQCCCKKILEDMEQECSSRGKGIREHEIQFCVVGNDVKALYPSMKFENTGKIIRKRIEKSEIEFNGFANKKGLAYICMNKMLTTELDDIEYMLPKRKSLLYRPKNECNNSKLGPIKDSTIHSKNTRELKTSSL